MSELKNNQPSLNEGTKEPLPKKKSRLGNIKNAVNKAIAEVGIAGSLLGGTIAPEVASTALIPETAATITTMAPTTGAAVKTIALGTAAALASACDRPDITPPTINAKTSIDIQGGEQVRVSGNQLYIGSNMVASWSDDISSNCMVSVTTNGNNILGSSINDTLTINIKVTDGAGNYNSASIKVNVLNNAPVITAKSSVNIFGGEKINISNNKLLLGDEEIASRSDDKTQNCTVSVKFNGKEVKSGDTINPTGEKDSLSITVTDDKGKCDSKEINITNNTIKGLETLKNLNMQVDQEVDLLKGISFADGIELVKVEVEMDGQRYQVNDPHKYTPEYPGVCNIIFTIKGKSGETKEVTSDTLNIKALEYKALEINNIRPVDILPIIGQVEVGDKKAYEHIEHLRVAEATKIVDMMRKYGAGKHTKEQYQQLMSRLNTGMRAEMPLKYNNYELIGTTRVTPDNHGYIQYHTLNTLIKHANFKIIGSLNDTRQANAINFIEAHPNSINIFGSSSYASADDLAHYKKNLLKDDIIYLCNLKNFLIFSAGTNIRHPEGVTKNKIYNGEYESDEHGVYSLASMANSDKNNYPNSHLLVTIATNANGDIDQTNERYESSKYPVRFANGKNKAKNVLFSGRTFPYESIDTDDNGGTIERIVAESGKYATSHTNFVNVALTCLCFQMFAEIEDVDQLLEMIRSTALTDYIRFNGETQELQLINPAGFIKEYLMPNNIPSSIQHGEFRSLEKGYYKGVIFDIPGAEVKIGGAWVPYNKENEFLIKSQNPMSLIWRINGDSCKKLGYKKGDTIKGKIIVIDDEWNGLNIEKEITINVK